MALNVSAFSMFVQPLSSQVFRLFVRPSMAYFESVMNLIGMKGSVFCKATSIAVSSPIWFDCD